MQENTPTVTKQQANPQDGPLPAVAEEGEMTVTVERELVSQAEEEDMEALLGTYVTSFTLLQTLHMPIFARNMNCLCLLLLCCPLATTLYVMGKCQVFSLFFSLKS